MHTKKYNNISNHYRHHHTRVQPLHHQIRLLLTTILLPRLTLSFSTTCFTAYLTYFTASLNNTIIPLFLHMDFLVSGKKKSKRKPLIRICFFTIIISSNRSNSITTTTHWHSCTFQILHLHTSIVNADKQANKKNVDLRIRIIFRFSSCEENLHKRCKATR